VVTEVRRMKIPLRARVQCTDGLDGRVAQVIVSPITKEITHVVVEEAKPPHIERLVPVRVIVATAHKLIHLNCSRQELSELTPLIEAEFLWAEIPGLNESHPYLLHPYVIPDRLTTKQKSLSPEELGIRRGARVHATDGKVGWGG
jgi:hypothetical protein